MDVDYCVTNCWFERSSELDFVFVRSTFYFEIRLSWWVLTCWLEEEEYFTEAWLVKVQTLKLLLWWFTISSASSLWLLHSVNSATVGYRVEMCAWASLHIQLDKRFWGHFEWKKQLGRLFSDWLYIGADYILLETFKNARLLALNQRVVLDQPVRGIDWSNTRMK
jgi:hypothetical protein